jgi:hypothetical protein
VIREIRPKRLPGISPSSAVLISIRSFAKRRLNRQSPLCKNQKRLCRKDRDFYQLGIRRPECPRGGRHPYASEELGYNRAIPKKAAPVIPGYPSMTLNA